jgi:hypothetical protein
MTTLDSKTGEILSLPSIEPYESDQRKKYHLERCEDAVRFLAEGHTKTQLCAYWGISFETLQKWINSYPEFKESMDLGMTFSEAKATQVLWEFATKKREGNLGALVFYMCNVYKKNFTQKNDSQSTVTINNIGNLTVSERRAKIEKFKAQLEDKSDE